MAVVFSVPDAGLLRNLKRADEVAAEYGGDATVKQDPATDTWNVHVPDGDDR
ncbi:hypothetical protein [Streptomyces africanus]|uniref:hypothetical protein n=1 Tax=Streptomyces africanus TaxID=231024 RepID=UPI001302894A|nr:hypothetical protein [Streptomyces africanus]